MPKFFTKPITALATIALGVLLSILAALFPETPYASYLSNGAMICYVVGGVGYLAGRVASSKDEETHNGASGTTDTPATENELNAQGRVRQQEKERP